VELARFLELFASVTIAKKYLDFSARAVYLLCCRVHATPAQWLHILLSTYSLMARTHAMANAGDQNGARDRWRFRFI
jgi:hypothetical protein